METTTAVVGALLVMSAVTVAATVTGNGKALCDAMGGTYTPTPPPGESCPGGKWLNIILPTPAPTK